MDHFKILEREELSMMASPFRQGLLQALSSPNSAAGLARQCNMSRQRVGYHMRELERSGCIEAVGERKARGLAEKLYQTKPLAFVYSPLNTERPERTQDRYSWASLVNLAAQTLWDLLTLRRRADAVGKRLATLALEAELHFDSPAERKAFTGDLIDAVGSVVRKYEHPRSDSSRAFRIVLGAYPKPEPGKADDKRNAQH
jgi:biotin operon repressor